MEISQIYSFRKNLKNQIKISDKIIKVTAAFKTKETEWLHTNMPVIIPIKYIIQLCIKNMMARSKLTH